MNHRLPGMIRWLPVLVALLVVPGCDADAGLYPSNGADTVGADPEYGFEGPLEDVASGLEYDQEPMGEDVGADNGDMMGWQDGVADTGADVPVGSVRDAGEDVPEAPDGVSEPDLVEPITCAPTQQDAQGPYYVPGAPFTDAIAGPDEPGDRLLIKGVVRDEDCMTLPGVIIDVWQTDAFGAYPGEDEGFRLRGRVEAGADGFYAFETVLPGFYEGRPRHIHLKVSAPDHVLLTTQVYFKGDPWLWPNDSCGPPTCHSDDPARIVSLTELGIDDESILVGDLDLVLAAGE